MSDSLTEQVYLPCRIVKRLTTAGKSAGTDTSCSSSSMLDDSLCCLLTRLVLRQMEVNTSFIGKAGMTRPTTLKKMSNG